MGSKKIDDNFFGKNILNSLEGNICLLDEKGNIEFANTSWFNFAKENNAEIERVSEGCNYLEVCDNAEGDDKDLAKQIASGIRSVINGKKDKFELEYPCHSPSVKRWFLAKVTPYNEPENTAMRKVVVFHVDITERKKAEIELKQTNNLFEGLFESIQEGICILNFDLTIRHTNKTIKSLYKSEIPLEGKKCYEVYHKRDIPCDPCPSIRCLETGEVEVEEKSFPTEAGWKRNEILSYPLYERDYEKPTGVVEFVREITERKELEEHLNIQAQMLDIAPGFIIVHDFDGNIYYVNQHTIDLHGFTKEEFMNMKLHEINTPESLKQISSRMEEVDKKGETHFEVEHYRKDGSTLPLDIYVKKIQWYGKEAILSIGTDITERKQIENKLQESYKELEVKQKQIDNELEKARKIHENTLLGKFSEVSSPEDISLEAHYYPAQRIGGDFYNFIRTEDKLIVYLSDVTGHGIEAAIISTFVKETIENYVDLETGELTPEKILTHVYKQYIKNDFPEDYFVCLFLAVLDLNTYELSYTGAGMHFPPFVKLADGNCVNLHSEGPPISGVIGLDLMDFREGSITLTPGSIVLFYTDGIAEQKNEDYSFYGERLKNTFYSQHSKFPPELVKQVINNDFEDFNGSLQGDDDITYVILQINPPERKQYYWQINSTSQELENLYSEVFPILNDYVSKESTIQGLYEVIVNAMEHGNNFDSNKNIYIYVVLTNEYVFATVEDEGKGFDWKEKMSAKTQDIIDCEKERGRGILMARSLCDGLFYNEKGNKAFLILESKA